MMGILRTQRDRFFPYDDATTPSEWNQIADDKVVVFVYKRLAKETEKKNSLQSAYDKEVEKRRNDAKQFGGRRSFELGLWRHRQLSNFFNNQRD